MIKGLLLTVALLFVIVGGYFTFFNTQEGITGHTVTLLPKSSGTSETPDSSSYEKIKLSPEQTQVAYHGLILHILELRDNVGKDKLKQAELVNLVDQDIQKIGSDNIQERWDTTALCLAKSCADSDFLNLILTISIEGEKSGYKQGSLIMNLVTANKYWNTDNTIRFSEALDAANKQIQTLSEAPVTEVWQRLVTCDGKCPEQNNLTFELIRKIVESQK